MSTIKNYKLEKHPGQIDMDPITVIKKSLMTVSISPGGKMYLIGPDGTVFDPTKMPHAPKTLAGGTTFDLTKIVPTPKTTGSKKAGSSTPSFTTIDDLDEVRCEIPGGIMVCYVIDKTTGAVLGNCPKEQYM